MYFALCVRKIKIVRKVYIFHFHNNYAFIDTYFHNPWSYEKMIGKLRDILGVATLLTCMMPIEYIQFFILT